MLHNGRDELQPEGESMRRSRARRAHARALAALALTLALVLGAHGTAAYGDGDPASDYLLRQQVFMLSQSTQAPPAAQQALRQTVRAANRGGFQLRVAVISSSYDLGSVTELWRRPQTYARFLGIELSLAYKGRLLVVMPNGLGFDWAQHSTASAERTLAAVPIGREPAGEIEAARIAVRRLAAAAGVKLAPASSASAAAPGARPARASSTVPGAALLAGAGAALALALGVALGVALRRRNRRREDPAADAVGATAAARASASVPAAQPHAQPRAAPAAHGGWLRWALPGLAATLAVAAGVPLLALSNRPTPAASGQEAGQQGSAFTWPRGQRRAPELRLSDQRGQPVSLAAYRGRPVIVTFIDPLCRNLCPLEAKVLNQLDERLPRSRRPEILAVSVDVYADTHADLMQDFRRWSLVPQWRWAVGTPAQLESVWRRYYAEVNVQTKRIAGTVVHYITHSEMAYLIDGRGYERALFSWPFQPKDVERVLRRISRS
jgi:protein SCO1